MLRWLSILLFVVPLFFIWTVVHEGAHAVTAVAHGATITMFKPWPHIANNNVYFGRMGYRISKSKVTPLRMTSIHAAPLVVSLISFALLSFLKLFSLRRSWGRNVWLSGLLTATQFSPALDAINCLRFSFTEDPWVDIVKASNQSGISLHVFQSMFFLFVTVAVLVAIYTVHRERMALKGVEPSNTTLST